MKMSIHQLLQSSLLRTGLLSRMQKNVGIWILNGSPAHPQMLLLRLPSSNINKRLDFSSCSAIPEEFQAGNCGPHVPYGIGESGQYVRTEKLHCRKTDLSIIDTGKAPAVIHNKL